MIYRWILLSLRISVTTFLVFLVSVLLGIGMGFDDPLPAGNLSLWGTIEVFLSIVLYPVPLSVLFIFLMSRLGGSTRRKKIFFSIMNILWYVLVVSSFGNRETIELNDGKGLHNYGKFVTIMFFVNVLLNIFLVYRDRRSFDLHDKEIDTQRKNFQRGVVDLFIVYYACVVVAALISLFSLNSCFDGFILDEMLMTFNGTVAVVVLAYGSFLFLVERMRLRFLIVALVPVILLGYNFFVSHPGYRPFTDFHKFRSLVVHYNPLWLGEQERGHSD